MKGIKVEVFDGQVISTIVNTIGLSRAELSMLIAELERTKLELIEELSGYDDLEMDMGDNDD